MSDETPIKGQMVFAPPNYMDLEEFVNLGYLQEANRLFFHILGLNMEVNRRADGTLAVDFEDARSVPDGYLLYKVNDEKAMFIRKLLLDRAKARQEMLGFTVQPVKIPEGDFE